MKILFTHGYFIAEDEKEQKIMKPYPPLGILYISAWLDLHKYENDVYDTTFSTFVLLKEFLIKEKPVIIALYTNLMTKLNVINIMDFIAEHLPQSVVIIGGPDVRHNQEGYLEAGAQVLVIGEGEQTMLEIVQSIEKGNKTEFGHIDGVAYKSGDEIIQTKERSRIRPVDDLPYPNRHKINIQQYLDTWKQHHGQSAMTVSTQRGCPYTCKWCSTAVYGQSYRRRSPDIVADEIKYIKDLYNPDTIWFVDDVFSVSHKWIEEFKDEIIKKDALVPFECITRADRMNEDIVDWLQQAGCFRIWIGAESGSQKVIDLMDRRVDVNYVKEMIHMTKRKGLEAGTFIMLGYPGETEEDIQDTVQYLKDANPDFFTITIAYPIKGTSLYQEIEAKQTNELDWMQSTDRDRDFERTYSRKYYEYAVRWVENEVNWHKELLLNNRLNLNSLKFKLKSLVLRSLMRFAK